MQFWQDFLSPLQDSIGHWIAIETLASIVSFVFFFVLLTGIKLLITALLRKRRFKQKDFVLAIFRWIYILVLFLLLTAHFSDLETLKRTVFSLGTADISVLLLGTALFIFILFFRLSRLIQKHILPTAYERYKVEAGTQFTLSSIFHYVILVFAILITLNAMGITITSLTVFAGIFGVGIGFGMQNIVSNFISGIILLFERPIKVGDIVELDGVIGEVMEIKIRSTIVKSLNNEHLIVPNSFFLEQKITNRSYDDLKMRTTLEVGVSYSSDVRLVEQLLLQAVSNILDKTGFILDQPEPFVRFTAFGDSSLNFKLYVWIDTPNNVYVVKSELHYEILKLFRENSIEIPFPQRDLHMKG